MSISGIYKITCIVNGKSYIGKTKGDIEARVMSHFNGYNSGCTIIFRAIKKHGKENFTWEILHENVDYRLLDNLEKEAIKNHNSKHPHGYNLTDGGDGVINPSDKVRKKMSNAKKGKKASLKTRQKMSEARKGRVVSKETRTKISKANTGRKGYKHSPESRQKISEATKGKNHPMYGKKHSIASREKMSESHKGKTTWMKGKSHTQKTKTQISENLKNNPLAKQAQIKATKAAVLKNTGRAYPQEHCNNISKATQSAEYKEAYNLYHSLPSAMDISEKRNIVKAKFPDKVKNKTIYRWFNKWQSEKTT